MAIASARAAAARWLTAASPGPKRNWSGTCANRRWSGSRPIHWVPECCAPPSASGSSASCAAPTASAAGSARRRSTANSQTASPAIRTPAKKWVARARADVAAHAANHRQEPPFAARPAHHKDAAHSATRSAYGLASCEYQIISGLTTVSAAATRPARREASVEPAR